MSPIFFLWAKHGGVAVASKDIYVYIYINDDKDAFQILWTDKTLAEFPSLTRSKDHT
jgi:hypothetical protein